ncbi:MAG: N-acetyltransferase [Sediminibacterium sp.]|nr:N-acetyltransferase [Sediminibacterium sp.]
MEIIFETKRLLLREFTTDDAALIYELNSNPEVVKYVHEEPITDVKVALTSIIDRIIPQYINYGYGRWAMHLKGSLEFIGWCGLKYRPERDEVDLGYRFKQPYWGKGYATEAALATLQYGFETLDIPVITAMAHIDNTASLKVIEKCGMQFQGFEEVEGCPVKTYTFNNPYTK